MQPYNECPDSVGQMQHAPAASFQNPLKVKRMKFKRIHFAAIDSTNTWAKANAHLFEEERLTLVTAGMQREGRGRLNRQWVSPESQNLYASFCFLVPHSNKNLFNLSQVLSVSACKTLEELGFAPKIKWPNDLMLNHKKVGGILCETLSLENGVCMVAGIGININMPQAVAETIGQPATSLLIEGGKSYEVEKAVSLLASIFQSDLESFLENGFSPFFDPYTRRLIYYEKQPLKIRENKGFLEGHFVSVNTDGSLNLELPSGEIKKIYSGEIGDS